MTIHKDQHGFIVQAGRPALSQTIAIGGSSVQSANFQSGPPVQAYAPDGTLMTQPNFTTHVRLVATSNCWVAFGSNPTAVVSGTASIFLPAMTPEYFWVIKGERLAVIQDTAAGNLNIGELAQ